jgi:hypothetical protein
VVLGSSLEGMVEAASLATLGSDAQHGNQSRNRAAFSMAQGLVRSMLVAAGRFVHENVTSSGVMPEVLGGTVVWVADRESGLEIA